jgi:hypothetical protein
VKVLQRYTRRRETYFVYILMWLQERTSNSLLLRKRKGNTSRNASRKKGKGEEKNKSKSKKV